MVRNAGVICGLILASTLGGCIIPMAEAMVSVEAYVVAAPAGSVSSIEEMEDVPALAASSLVTDAWVELRTPDGARLVERVPEGDGRFVHAVMVGATLFSRPEMRYLLRAGGADYRQAEGHVTARVGGTPVLIRLAEK
jgi:hypothetical protein